MIQNHDTGAMASDGSLGQPSLIRIPIDVIPVDANGVITKRGWTFQGCFIHSLNSPKFSQTSGEAYEAAVGLKFMKRVIRT